ncbi:MAG TPA: ABC transporter permease, partial [Ruminococcaceae bacterium]|nr:ABC transporter permease [Oscillospiraceae bacterium]
MLKAPAEAAGLRKRKLKKDIPYYLMLLPFLLVFALFMLIPVLSAVAMSFTDFNMIQLPSFVGLDNYIRIFAEDEIFNLALKNTLLFAIITGPIGYILSFLVAWLINEFGKGIRSVITLIVYAPTLAGNVYFIWTYIFSPDSRGFLNHLLVQLGIVSDPIMWLTDAKLSFWVVVLVIVWLSFGAGFLSFIAGLQALDRTYYEAAAMDGLKNRWQELYYVTFPQMGPQLLFGAIMSISGAFAVGYQNMALTGFPSTDYATHTLVLHIMDFG